MLAKPIVNKEIINTYKYIIDNEVVGIVDSETRNKIKITWFTFSSCLVNSNYFDIITVVKTEALDSWLILFARFLLGRRIRRR